MSKMPRFILILILPLWLVVMPQLASAAAGWQLAIDASFVVRSNDLEERLLGSGFRFLEEDLAVTNAHVVGNADTVLLVTADGRREVARVIARDPVRDIALLRVSRSQAYLRPGPDQPGLGQVVYAIGAPYEAEFSLSRGIVSAVARQIEANVPVRMVQHDAAANPGSSGGALVDAQGRLIGMNSQIADGFRNFIGITYAIPANTMVAIVNHLQSGGETALPRLGLRTRPVDAKIAAAMQMEERRGILIDSVSGGSAADLAGIRPGDILLELGGRPLLRIGDLAFALESVAGQERFDAVVWRNGAQVRVTLANGHEVVPAAARGGEPARRALYSFSETGMQVGADGIILDVTDYGLAHYEGLRAGDRILAVNGAMVTEGVFDSFEITRPVLLLIEVSDGSTKHIVLDPWAKPGKMRPVSGANVLDESVVVF